MKYQYIFVLYCMLLVVAVGYAKSPDTLEGTHSINDSDSIHAVFISTFQDKQKVYHICKADGLNESLIDYKTHDKEQFDSLCHGNLYEIDLETAGDSTTVFYPFVRGSFIIRKKSKKNGLVVVYAENHGTLFKIVGTKDSQLEGLRKHRVYTLNICSVFPERVKGRYLRTLGVLILRGIDIGGRTVEEEFKTGMAMGLYRLLDEWMPCQMRLENCMGEFPTSLPKQVGTPAMIKENLKELLL